MLEKLCKNIPKARKNIHDKFDDGRKYIPLKSPRINRVKQLPKIYTQYTMTNITYPECDGAANAMYAAACQWGLGTPVGVLKS